MYKPVVNWFYCSSCIIIERLRFHYENENDFLCADVIISCVLPVRYLVVDDEMEATRSSL